MRRHRLCKCKVSEAMIDGDVHVLHIPGIINASNIFTKELKDGAHFRQCCDLMMVSKSNFMSFHYSVPEHMTTQTDLPYYSIRSPDAPSNSPTKYPISNKSQGTTVGKTDPPTPIAKQSNICKAQ